MNTEMQRLTPVDASAIQCSIQGHGPQTQSTCDKPFPQMPCFPQAKVASLFKQSALFPNNTFSVLPRLPSFGEAEKLPKFEESGYLVNNFYVLVAGHREYFSAHHENDN